jgi:hypothetical protein
MIFMNGALGSWSSEPDKTEKYVLRQFESKERETFSDVVESFRSAIVAAKEKLENQF